jgi:GNAT superfamily N-acetyltransferase
VRHDDVHVVERVGEVGGELGGDVLGQVLGGAHDEHAALAEQRRAQHVGQVTGLQLGGTQVAHVDLGVHLAGGPDDARHRPRDEQVLVADHDGQRDEQRCRHADHRPTVEGGGLAPRPRRRHGRSVPPTSPASFVPLPPAVLAALLDGDLAAAGERCGVELPPFFLEEGWLWQIRLDQVRADPAAEDWVVRAVVVPPAGVVGHAGFHGPPDADGVVEVGYTVVPELRGRGYARAALAALVAEAAACRRCGSCGRRLRPTTAVARGGAHGRLRARRRAGGRAGRARARARAGRPRRRSADGVDARRPDEHALEVAGGVEVVRRQLHQQRPRQVVPAGVAEQHAAPVPVRLEQPRLHPLGHGGVVEDVTGEHDVDLRRRPVEQVAAGEHRLDGVALGVEAGGGDGDGSTSTPSTRAAPPRAAARAHSPEPVARSSTRRPATSDGVSRT